MTLTLKERLNTHTVPYLARLLGCTPEEAIDREVTWILIAESEEAKSRDPLGYNGIPIQEYSSLRNIYKKAYTHNDLGFGVFLAVNHTGTNKRTKVDVKEIRAIYADIDNKKSDGLTFNPQVMNLDPLPSIVNATGNGYHLYWTLPTPVQATPDSIQLAERAMRGIQEIMEPFGADRAVCEVARVLRVPGFFNMKVEPKLVSLYSTKPESHDLETLSSAFPFDGPIQAGSVEFSFQSELDEEERYELATAWLEEKEASVMGENGSSALMSASWVGPGFGLDYDQALILLMEDYNPKCEPEWSEKELRHKLDDAYESAIKANLVGCHLPDFQEQAMEAALTKWDFNEDETPETQEEETDDETPDIEQKEDRTLICSQFTHDDIGLANRLKTRYFHILKFYDKDWYYYNGKFWEVRPDAPLKLLERVKNKVPSESKHLADNTHLLKWFGTIGMAARLEGAIRTAKSLMFQKEPFNTKNSNLINFQNGTLDISTGNLLPHNPYDNFLYCLSWNYDSNAVSPTWSKYLLSVFDGDVALIDYLQNLIGATLHSYADHEFSVWLSGGGSNGKTTFTETMQHALGPLSQQIPNDIFLTKKFGQSHPTEIARLHQKKFATCSDISLNSKLDEGTFKRLVSTGKAVGRYMNRDFFEFEMSHKFWISVNNLPSVYDESWGLWRRMIVIPFNHKFGPDERDPLIKTNLKNEVEGVWAWMVEGAIKFQKSGLLPTPKSVVDAVENWRKEEDWFTRYMEENALDFVDSEHGKEGASTLYSLYEDWCKKAANLSPMKQKSFSAKLKEVGLVPFKTNGIMYYKGIKKLEEKGWDDL